MRRVRKPVCFIVLFTFCLSLFCGGFLFECSEAEATYAVPGLQKDKMYDVINHYPSPLKYVGDWNLQVSGGSTIGKSSALFEGAYGYNFVRNYGSIPTQLVRDMGGEPSWVSSNRPPNYLLNGQSVFHIRQLAIKCGASVSDTFNMVNIYPTEPPTNLRINPPSTIRVNESVNIQISANSNVPPQSGTKALTWELTVDGKKYNGYSSNNLNSTQGHTFTSSGTKTITLKATDTIGRSSQTSITVTVQAASIPPPPPSSGPGPPVADFLMPSTASVNSDVSIMCNSYSPSGLSFTRSWSVSPSNYTGTLSGASSTIRFPNIGNYAVTLTVTDSKGASDSRTKHISVVEGYTPPPPPLPPEPENIPPVARFSMPSKTGQATTVNVTNNSYDPDGTIVNNKWVVSPSTGVVKNLNNDGGTITFNETGTFTVELTVTDNDGDSDSTSKSIEVVNLPPVAKISIPSEVLQGDDINVKCTSYDPDGEVVRRTWSVTPSESVIGTLEGVESQIYFDKEGTYTITLEVEDNFGLTNRTSKGVIVKPALPNAFITESGALKQNRKVTLTEAGTSVSRYPIVTAHNEWKIEPVSGGATLEAIKIGSTSTLKEQHVLFKTPGIYKISLRVENTAGHKSEWYTRNLTIIEDSPPVADFFVQSAFLRNPTQGNLARLQLSDMSYSDDGDIISQRTWRYKFDNNNNGSFDDESWIVFSDVNETTPYVNVPKVGKYMFELNIVETFGEETIEEFITPADTRTANTLSKPLGEKRTEVINSRPAVAFDVHQKKKVDVIFTVGDVNSSKLQNLQGLITQYLESELNSHNVEYGTIKSVESYGFSSESANMGLLFNNWRSINVPNGQEVSGGWEYDQNLKAVVATGGYRPARGWYDPSPDSIDMRDATIKFTWGIRGSASFEHGEAGYMFRIQDDKNYYIYIWSNHSACGNIRLDGGDAIVKVVNGNIHVLEQKTGFPRFFPDQQEKFEIRLEGNNIKVYLNGSLRYDINDSTYAKGSHGFYVWDQMAAYFKDIAVETTRITTLDEILKQPMWRDDALHFLVNLSDVIYPEFNDPIKAAYIYNRLLADEIDFSVMGTSANQAQANSIIAKNDGNGIFVNNTNMANAMQQIAVYIINKVNTAFGGIDNYVLLNEEVSYKTYYEDYESDPKFAERWIYDHDHTYFENSLGQAPYHNQYIPGPVYRFDQVGHFKTRFAARDNPVATDDRFDEYRLWSYMSTDHLDLYVHRRPVGTFTFQLTPSGNNYNITFPVVDAYDLDHLSKPGKGITEHKWQWRLADSDTWNSGQPSVLAKDQDYLIRYQVTDLEGARSYPQVRLVTTRNYNLPPVAQFTVTPNPVVVNKTFEITDTSFDPNGTPITIREWRVRPPGGTFTSSPKPSTFNQVGTYRIELKVSDGELWSEPFYQDVSVIPDNNPPVAEFTINHPTPCYDYSTVTYIDTSWDPDGDPIEAREWRISKNGGPWVNYINPPTTFDGPGLGAGSYRIQLRVKDKPRLPQLEAKWSAWAERTLTVADGFIVEGTVIPQPGERGRDLRITGLAKKPSTGELTSIDSMEVHIVIDNMPAGMPTHVGTMEEKLLGRWEYVYRVPEKVESGKWPDDGFYTIRIIGRKSGTVKEDDIQIEIKGHILERTIIRTYRW